MKNKKLFIFPIVALSGLFIASCNNTARLSLQSASSYVKVTFDANGGKIGEDLTKTFQFRKGLTWQYVSLSAPKASTITKTGYTVDETNTWSLKQDGTSLPQPELEFKTDTILYARYTPKKINVKLNPNGGKFSDLTTDTKTVEVDYDSKFGTIKSSYIPTAPAGKEFVYYVNKDNLAVNDDYVFTNNNEELKATYLDVGTTVNITFNATSEGTIYDKQQRTYPIPVGLKWSAVKDNIVATPTDDAKKFKEYTHTTLGTLKDDTVISKEMNNQTFNATYEFNAATDFATDSWGTVLHYATSLSNLKTAYNKTTFVGLERVVKVDNIDYKVRVIGEDHDTFTDGSKTVLTFEFENIIDTHCFDDGIEHNVNTWHVSSLYTYLNDGFINRISDTSLKTNLNNKNGVKKNTWSNEANPKAIVENTENKIFVLSAKEMGFDKYPDTSTAVQEEGTTYSYYSNTSVDKTKSFYGKTDKSIYWLRSPDTLTNFFTWNVNESGTLGVKNAESSKFEPYDINYSIGYAPAFCI